MKSTIAEKTLGELTYPCLLKYVGSQRDPLRDTEMFVVLKTGPSTGTVVQCEPNSNWPLGYHSTGWTFEDFVPFVGVIQLEN